jgi:gamma-glutamylcyclotransferase (GGCT)/AIG2-like uncharacterized protein YtfP
MTGKAEKKIKRAKAGNPKILEQNEPYRFPAISPNEPSVHAGFRLPESKLKAVDALGDRSKMLRQAVDLLLTQSEASTTVWLLFENNPGHPGPILGVFSSPALAMETPRVQEVIGSGTWEERTPILWIFTPAAGEELYFSVEGWQIDR